VLALEEVLALVDEGITTSGPSPGDFLDAIERLGNPDGTLVLTVSRELADSTYEGARVASRMAPGTVRVVDTATAAGAQGLVVLAAAHAATAGGTLGEVEAEARRVIGRVRLLASLDNLDHVARGGHVPGLLARAGTMVGVRPLLELRHGKVHVLRPSLSKEAARDRMLSIWRASRPEHARLHVAVLHALAPHDAGLLLEAVTAEVEPATMFVGHFSTAMAVHSGPDLTGLAWWWEAED
jgi:DegV family protein with EDD domain